MSKLMNDEELKAFHRDLAKVLKEKGQAEAAVVDGLSDRIIRLGYYRLRSKGKVLFRGLNGMSYINTDDLLDEVLEKNPHTDISAWKGGPSGNDKFDPGRSSNYTRGEDYFIDYGGPRSQDERSTEKKDSTRNDTDNIIESLANGTFEDQKSPRMG